MTTLVHIINLEYDLIEIHHNPIIKIKPYLIRIYNYDNIYPNEIRLDETEIKDLYDILKEHKLL